MSHLEQVFFGKSHPIPPVARFCGHGFAVPAGEIIVCSYCKLEKQADKMHLTNKGRIGVMCQECHGKDHAKRVIARAKRDALKCA